MTIPGQKKEHYFEDPPGNQKWRLKDIKNLISLKLTLLLLGAAFVNNFYYYLTDPDYLNYVQIYSYTFRFSPVINIAIVIAISIPIAIGGSILLKWEMEQFFNMKGW